MITTFLIAYIACAAAIAVLLVIECISLKKIFKGKKNWCEGCPYYEQACRKEQTENKQLY